MAYCQLWHLVNFYLVRFFTKNFTKYDRLNMRYYALLCEIFGKFSWYGIYKKMPTNLENSGFSGKELIMTRVLFVCHGNICRSTLAQSLFTHMVKERKLENEFIIDSAATSTEEIGNPPHRGTVVKLKEMQVPLVPHRARQVTWRDYENFDYIIGMDSANMRNMNRMLKGDPDGKVYKLLGFAGSDRDIADPWYTGNFDETYEDVEEGCTAFLKFLGY